MPDRWDRVASMTAAWARDRGVTLRDAVLLVPFAQLLPPARRAFARAGGWMPRIETTRTLAASLGPAAPSVQGQISFDVAIDTLSAATLLRSQPWGATWSRRDARGFEQAAVQITATAHALAQTAFALPPEARVAHWATARDALVPMGGPGGTERLLARVALEWAAFAPAPATDRLFAMPAPSAWIVVRAGGDDALTTRLLAACAVPSLIVDADPVGDDPVEAVPEQTFLTRALCDDFEHEAQCAAAQVLAHVRAGETPVALIALDRVLVRRVRALLDREQVELLDETGWKLSTTRAGAQVMALLQAARGDASTDALLDWLKAGTVWAPPGRSAALDALEASCRRLQIASIAALRAAELTPGATRLRDAAIDVLDRLRATPRQTLGAWLAALAEALDACGAMSALQGDDAGRQVLAALRLVRGAGAASDVTMHADAFRDWVDGVLEQATFLPSSVASVEPEVVITPLARAMLRPFAAAVLPGADDKRLGAMPAADTLLGDALGGQLGLPTLAQRREAELLAFMQVLAVPRVTLMRRRLDGNDPLGDSPLVERLGLALAQHGTAMRPWVDPRVAVAIEPMPIRMSAPSAPELLPKRLSASSCEALRACPYRFFALQMLRLREDDELEREIEKRDYGTWLHAVLFEFHAARETPASTEAEIAELLRIAGRQREAQGLSDADFLPFGASFETFAPRYVAWLHERDRAGARWLRGEHEVSMAPPAFDGIELRGVIDRIDEVRDDGVVGLQLIDYKTGGLAGLKDKVKEPLEDTQLAFYAALMQSQSALPLTASYLAVDGTKGIDEVRHPDVQTSAVALLDGLASDLQRLRGGAGLPALGEGITCEYCAARGVCRRDHWSER